jgi:Domain of unknown function (DUF5130)
VSGDVEARGEQAVESPGGDGEHHFAQDGHRTLQHGPAGSERPDSPFTSRQLARLDEALTLSSRECGLTFSVYVGPLEHPTRGHAEQLFRRLADSAVLIAVSPGQRTVHIVTGEESAKRLPNRACALAALTMRASFSNGDLTGGLVNGLRMLADSAGRA